MSLLSVSMPASGPFCTDWVKSWTIVAHLPMALCSAWDRLPGLVPGPGASMPSALSAEPGGTRKPYCSASAAPR